LKSKEYLSDSVARFDYYKPNGTGIAGLGRVFKIHTDFYYYSPAEQLDYALVRVEEAPLQHLLPDPESKDLSLFELLIKGKHRGYLTLMPRLIKENERVNIVQHADGKPLQVVMTQNYVVKDMSNTRVQYVADTMDGSSGSPVFNQNWEIVALHHSGEPYPRDSLVNDLKRAWKRRFRVNEGIPIRAILDDFKAKELQRYLPKS
jgi:V8-like Glu-specific endopeptidase